MNTIHTLFFLRTSEIGKQHYESETIQLIATNFDSSHFQLHRIEP